MTEMERFAKLWLELQMAHDAHTLPAYDHLIGETGRKCLESQPVVPITYDDLGQVIGYGDVDALLARDTTAD